MAKTYTFKELFMNWQKAKVHLEEIQAEQRQIKVESHSRRYYDRYTKGAEKAEQFWLEKMGDYGKGIIIQATGCMHGHEFDSHLTTFTIFLVNANVDEVKEYLMARFPNIRKETIELKEFQTGILNV